MKVTKNKYFYHLSRWLMLMIMSWPTLTFGIDSVFEQIEASNVTPFAFTVIWKVNGESIDYPGLDIYADADGTQNVSGDLQIEFYPEPVSGANVDPEMEYADRMAHDALVTQVQNRGIVLAQVSGASANTDYHFRPRAYDETGADLGDPQIALSVVKTANETLFIEESRQVLFDFRPEDAVGALARLSQADSPYPLYSIIGDGEEPHLAYFNLSDLLDSAGHSNAVFSGSKEFEISVLGLPGNDEIYVHQITFTGEYLTADLSEVIIKAIPVITWNAPASIVYGAQLNAQTVLNATADTDGSFEYTPPADSLLNAGDDYTISTFFTPDNDWKYETVTMDVLLDVEKAVPLLAWAEPASIIQGTGLGLEQLNASSEIEGVLNYNPPSGTLLFPGDDQLLIANFSPADTQNYEPASHQVNIDVINRIPEILEGPLSEQEIDEDNAPRAFNLSLHGEDAINDTLSWEIANPASNGTASVVEDDGSAQVLFTPAPNWYGSDTFMVRLNDDFGGSDEIQINVNVLPINDAPEIAPVAGMTAYPGIRGGPVLLAISDVDNDPDDLVIATMSSDTNFIPDENVTVRGFGENRRLYFNPSDTPPGLPGNLIVSALVTDGEAVTRADVDVTVAVQPDTLLTRTLPGEYLPGSAHRVELESHAMAGSGDFSVSETIPAGWAVSDISHGGVLDTGPNTITWSGLNENDTLNTPLSFIITPPVGSSGTGQFSGQSSTATTTLPILGDERLPLPPIETLAQWLERVFAGDAGDPDVTGPSVDLNEDGVNNLLARAFDLDPLAPETGRLPGIYRSSETDGSDYLNFIFRRSKTVDPEEIDFTLWASENLDLWNKVASTPVIIGEDKRAWLVEVKVPIDLLSKKMLRMEVSEIEQDI